MKIIFKRGTVLTLFFILIFILGVIFTASYINSSFTNSGIILLESATLPNS
ncbi:hypothetical protein ACH3O9_06970 [Leeuwenhoekiella sp. A16]|uniref:hypothetical protein n=1 Tax=unclassified Leeuwenhoekiella TaxID=2615029 RepID=UPI003A8070E2